MSSLGGPTWEYFRDTLGTGSCCLKSGTLVPWLPGCSLASSGRAVRSRADRALSAPVFLLLISCKEMVVLSTDLCGATLLPCGKRSKVRSWEPFFRGRSQRLPCFCRYFLLCSLFLKLHLQSALEPRVGAKLQLLECCLVGLRTGRRS